MVQLQKVSSLYLFCYIASYGRGPFGLLSGGPIQVEITGIAVMCLSVVLAVN